MRGRWDILIKKDDQYVPIKRKVVIETLDSYADKFIQTIHNILKTSHIDGKLSGGIVTIGGASLLPGLIERIEKTLNTTVFLPTLDIEASNFKQPASPAGRPAVFASAIGVAKEGFRSSSNPLWLSSSKSSWVEGMSQRVRELYHEYF